MDIFIFLLSYMKIGCIFFILLRPTVLEVVGKLKLDTVPLVPVKYCKQPSGP